MLNEAKSGFELGMSFFSCQEWGQYEFYPTVQHSVLSLVLERKVEAAMLV